jgi:hypothetical protein
MSENNQGQKMVHNFFVVSHRFTVDTEIDGTDQNIDTINVLLYNSF